ncbi:hypothetical protein B5X24_HaOG214388 [Helicoverpa armigera]|nr:hypothetical protein B5X24_HaOG214388 [Helicoverpa armigera]
MKPYRGRQTDIKYQDKICKFISDSHSFFDICSCKCKVISDCNCPKECRIPKKEVDFLLDQRTTRKMMIGGVDVATTAKIRKNKKEKKKLYIAVESSRALHQVGDRSIKCSLWR